MTKRKSNTKRGSNPTTKPEENGTGRVTCLISWVYEDDGDGNTSFGDITRSYFSVAALDKQEQESIKKWLKPYYDAGMIMDASMSGRTETRSTISWKPWWRSANASRSSSDG